MMATTGWQPLTAMQQGIWYAEARAPGRATFTTGQVLFLDGPVDRDLLTGAVRQVLGEAECLRLRFRQGAEGPEQALIGTVPELALRDMAGASAAEMQAACMAEARRPLDPVEGPVARFTLWWREDGEVALSQCLHHLVADGFANGLITTRVAQIYAALSAGRAVPPGFPGFARVVELDRIWRDDPEMAAMRDWWRAELQDLGEVAAIRPGPALASDWFHRHEIALAPEVRAALLARAEAAGVSWADMLTALSGAFLARHAAEGETVLGVPLMNRMGHAAARVPSTLVNVLPWRVRIDEDAALDDWLRDASARLAALRRNGRLRGETLRRELGRIGGNRRLHGPLVNVLPFDPVPRIPGLATRLEITGAGAVDDMTVHFRGNGRDGLRLQVDTNPALYDAAETAALAERLAEFLRRAAGAAHLAAVQTLSPAELVTHLETRNATAHPVPETTLAALIEAQMAATPDAVALEFEGQSLSYAGLEARSRALAGALAARGIGPGARVAVALPRSLDLLVALVAVLRAGAAYVPLDPEDGSERRRHMLEQAAPALVLAGAGFPQGAVLSPGDWPVTGGTTGAPCPGDLAYVLFTSGSTGRPKGVAVTHDAIVNRLLWMAETYGIGAGARVLQKTPATFDVSVWEFFLPLLVGATLVIAPPGEHRDPRALARRIREKAIDTLHFVPSMLGIFLDAPEVRGLRIPRVFCSGEGLAQPLADRFHELIEGRLHNLYGPTEAAVDVSFHEARPGIDRAAVPIGRPVWNTGMSLRDARLRPVPDGVPGRLYLSGRQLAQGYFGQPGLTAERFPADPLDPARRLYDTGDIAVSDSAGVITYQGRADQQVKIRGVRIEAGEVEAAATATGLVAQAAAGLWRDPGGTAHLALWVLPREGAGAEEIAAALALALPDTHRPGFVIPLARWPLTPSGKLDRKALPAPSRAVLPGRAARPGAEMLLARLYAEVLSLPGPAAPGTDFFAAGGDSLAAVKLAMRIEEETGSDPGLGLILEAPVLEVLARRLEDRSRDDGLGRVLWLSPRDREGTPLVLLPPAGGLGWCYRRLAALIPDRPVLALQSPLFDPGAAEPESLAALAADYAATLGRLFPEGRLHLAGWSLGGIIAHAMAAALGPRRVATLALIDAYPSRIWRNEPEPDRGAALRALLAMAGLDPERHRDLDTAGPILALLARHGHPLASLPAPVTEGVIRSVMATNRLVRAHRERVFGGPLLHLAAVAEHRGTERQPGLWAAHADAIRPVALEFRHAQMVGEDAAPLVAAALRAAMADHAGVASRQQLTEILR